MSVGSAAIAKWVTSIWSSSGLNAKFKALWSEDTGEFVSLNDQEARPKQPWPYCVLGEITGAIADNQSQEGSKLFQTRNYSVMFGVYARAITGDSRTAKGIAAYLAEEIMKVFGGHPTVGPHAALQSTSIDDGGLIIVQYLRDYGMLLGDDEYQWIVDFNVMADISITV